MQSLLNQLRERSLPVIMWSQVDSLEKVEEIMSLYLVELNYLTALLDTLSASTQPQFVSYQTKLLDYKEDIAEVSQWTSEQKPITFRADEQTPSKRFARKGIQRVRGNIDAMLVSLLPA